VDITAIGSLLKYGLPGLVLGLFLGAIGGVVGRKLTDLTVEALRICFKYALFLVILTCIANVVPLVLDYLAQQRSARMTIAVNVAPSLGKNYPNAVAHVSTDLTPHPISNQVDVSTHGTNSTVKVDVSDIAKELKDLGLANADLKSKVSMLKSAADQNAKLYATMMPAPQAIRDTVTKVVTSSDGPATAADTCRTANQALCGWARLATGNIQAAQASFTAASVVGNLPKDQVASAQNGLGYTYLTQGNTSEAILQTTQAANAGDHGAAKQLQAIDVVKAKDTEQ
jgi:hypothetical protein